MKKRLLLIAVTIIAPMTARADVITFQGALNIADTNYPGTQQFKVAPFDPALGKLNSVTITIEGQYSGYFQEVDYNPIPYTYPTSGPISTAIDVGLAPQFNHSFPVVIETVPFIPTANDSGFSAQVQFPVLDSVSVSAATVAQLEQETGPIIISVTDYSYYQKVSSNNIGSFGIAGDGFVRYAFTPVPEPASLALFGTGLFALTAFRRRAPLR